MTGTFVVAAVAFVRDGHVLTVRKRGTTRFMLPGGKLEPGESAYAAAVREIREEVGLRSATSRCWASSPRTPPTSRATSSSPPSTSRRCRSR